MIFKYIVTCGIFYLIHSSIGIYSMLLSSQLEHPLTYDILDMLVYVARNREQIINQSPDRNQNDRRPNGSNKEKKPRYMKIKHGLGNPPHRTSYEYTISPLSTNREDSENAELSIDEKVADHRFKDDENGISDNTHELLSPQLLESNFTWEAPVNNTYPNTTIST